MRFGKLKTLIGLGALLALIPIALALMLDAFIHHPAAQGYLLGKLSAAVGYEVRASDIRLTFSGGFGVAAEGVVLRSTEGGDSIAAETLGIVFDIRRLLRGRLFPRRISLHGTELVLSIRKDGPGKAADWELPDLLKHLLGACPSIAVERATVRIKDPAVTLEAARFSAEKTPDGPDRLLVNLSGTLRYRDGEVPLSFAGTVGAPDGEGAFPVVQGAVETASIPLTLFPWPEVFSAEEGTARVSVNVRILPRGRVETEGRVLAEKVAFLLTDDGRTKDFRFSYLALDFEASYFADLLDMPTFRLSGPRFYVMGACRLGMDAPSNPSLFLRIESSEMPVETAKKVCPTPILPAWIEGTLYPLVREGNTRLTQLVLDGSVDQLKTLERPGSAHAFAIGIDWNDVALESEKVPWGLEEVHGQLSIRKGDLRISGVQGLFGGSALRGAVLEMQEVFAPGTPLDITLDGDFDMGELLVLGSGGMIPGVAPDWFPGTRALTGTLQASIAARMGRHGEDVRLLRGELSSPGSTLVHESLKMPVDFDAFQLVLEQGGGSRFHGEGKWGGSSFTADVETGPSMPGLRARVSGTAEPSEVIPFLAGGPLPWIQFHDPVPCRFSARREVDAWMFDGEMDVKGMTVQGKTLRLAPFTGKKTIRVSGEIQPRREVRVDRFDCLWEESELRATGSFGLGETPWFSVEASSPGVRLEDVGLALNGTATPPTGTLKGRLRASREEDGPGRPALSGEVDGRGVQFTLADRPVTVRSGDFHLDLDRMLLDIRSSDLDLHDLASFQVRGEVRFGESLYADLSATARELDLEKAFAVFRAAVAEGPSRPSTLPEKGDVSFALSVDRARWRDLSDGPLEVEGRFDGNQLSVDRMTLALNHGMLSLSGRFGRGDAQDTRIAGHVRLRQQPVQDLLGAFGIRELSLEGPLTAEAFLAAEGANGSELLSGLSGDVTLVLDKGRITRSNVMMKVLQFMSVQKIWRERPPDMSKEGLYFESIGGRFSIRAGVAETESLAMKSPAFNAVARGHIELGRQWIESDLGVQPLGTIDFMLSRIPVIGYILTGEQGALLIYHFDVTGPVLQPEVSYTPLENIPGGVADFFKRVFLTPERLIRKIPGLGEGFTPEELRRFEKDLEP